MAELVEARFGSKTGFPPMENKTIVCLGVSFLNSDCNNSNFRKINFNTLKTKNFSGIIEFFMNKQILQPINGRFVSFQLCCYSTIMSQILITVVLNENITIKRSLISPQLISV